MEERSLITPCRVALAIAMLIYAVLLSVLSALKHASYHSSLIDLGIFDQVIWNTAHGRLFWDTLDPYVQHYHVFLGQHFSPGLALLVPVYWIAPSVYSLLVAQTLALTLAAVPIYILAARRLGDERSALALALAYLCSPALAYVNLFDFHEIAMAVPFLAWAVERLDAGRTKTALALLCLALLWKEEVGLIVAAFGLWVLVSQRRPALGALLVALGAGWTAAVVFWAIPHIRGGPYLFDSRYQGGLLQHGRLHLAYLTHFLSAQKLEYFGWLLLPLLGLPLLAGWPALLLAPTAAYTLLSTYPDQYNIHYHYSAPLLPLLFCGTVYGLLRLSPRMRFPVAVLVLALMLLSAWLVGPLPGQREFSPDTYRMGPRERALAALVARVPPGVSLAVDNQMGAHLTERVWVTHFFTGYERSQALLFDLREQSPTEAKRQRAIAAIEHDPHWHLIARDQDYVLYVRVDP
ncbi:MAG TPA: DUF2079 domain-containing protein [Chloroflexota bacterium]|nr:DUF2079 domain-containing protein [Chloroflexota bacterium]